MRDVNHSESNRLWPGFENTIGGDTRIRYFPRPRNSLIHWSSCSKCRFFTSSWLQMKSSASMHLDIGHWTWALGIANCELRIANYDLIDIALSSIIATPSLPTNPIKRLFTGWYRSFPSSRNRPSRIKPIPHFLIRFTGLTIHIVVHRQ